MGQRKRKQWMARIGRTKSCSDRVKAMTWSRIERVLLIRGIDFSNVQGAEGLQKNLSSRHPLSDQVEFAMKLGGRIRSYPDIELLRLDDPLFLYRSPELKFIRT